MVAVKSLHLPFRAWLGITRLKASPSLTTHTFFVSKKGLLLKAVALSSELRGQYFKERIQTNLNYSTNIRNNFQSSKYFFVEAQGFEPRVPSQVRLISSQAHSTALPNLRCEVIINKLLVVNTVKCVQEKLAMIFSTNLWTNIINRARTYC